MKRDYFMNLKNAKSCLKKAIVTLDEQFETVIKAE